MRIHLFALVLSLSTVAVSLGAGCDSSKECNEDAECGAGLLCTADFRCAACESAADCGADSFCCRGVCHGAADVQTLCGCGAAFSGSAGTDCTAGDEDALCLVGAAAASTANVQQGVCGCGCTPAEGGPICNPPLAAGDEPICSCVDNDDCRGPSVDVTGRPHLATDTCTPEDACVCFRAEGELPCDPDSAAPDCTSTGCQSLDDDINNCGVPGRVCTDAATGLDSGDGTCVDGGCRCDAATDCAGAANVSQCVFFGAEARCVCAGYTANGEEAACPLESTCGAAGCTLDGTSYGTQEDMLAALGIAP